MNHRHPSSARDRPPLNHVRTRGAPASAAKPASKSEQAGRRGRPEGKVSAAKRRRSYGPCAPWPRQREQQQKRLWQLAQQGQEPPQQRAMEMEARGRPPQVDRIEQHAAHHRAGSRGPWRRDLRKSIGVMHAQAKAVGRNEVSATSEVPHDHFAALQWENAHIVNRLS